MSPAISKLELALIYYAARAKIGKHPETGDLSTGRGSSVRTLFVRLRNNLGQPPRPATEVFDIGSLNRGGVHADCRENPERAPKEAAAASVPTRHPFWAIIRTPWRRAAAQGRTR